MPSFASAISIEKGNYFLNFHKAFPIVQTIILQYLLNFLQSTVAF